LTKLFKKNEKETEKMKDFFCMNNPFGYQWKGVFEYKDYKILHDIIPEENKLVKHISVSRKDNKEIEEKELNIICNHFLGEKYTIDNFSFIKGINAWEVKNSEI